MEICSNCESWRCHTDDRFCGYCGDCLLKVEVDLLPTVVFKNSTPPNNISVSIKSISGDLEGTRFFWQHQQEKNHRISISELGHDEIPIGATKTFTTSISEFGDFNQQYQTWDLLFCVITEATEKKLVELKLGSEEPQVELIINEICLPTEQTESTTFELIHRAGDCLSKGNLLLIPISEDTAWANGLQLESSAEQISLEIDEKKCFTLVFTPSQQEYLQTVPGGISFETQIETPGMPGIQCGCLTIYTAIPAQLILTFDEKTKIKALEGGMVSVGFALENRGGDADEIPKLQFILKNKEDTVFEIQHTLVKSKLQMRQTEYGHISLPLFDKTKNFDTGLYRLQCEPCNGNAHKELTTSTTVEIISKKAYQGIVTIDFGTTTTAVSCYKRPDMPMVIQLSETESYIPTAIAYYLDDQGDLCHCIGNEAQQIQYQQSNRNIAYFDNIKWLISSSEIFLLPDNSEHTIKQVAEDYLQSLKHYIENHPLILAELNKVCITQPARFDPKLAKTLVEVYKTAGMMPEVINLEHNLHAISESWSSVTLCMPSAELKKWQVAYNSFDNDPQENQQDFGKKIILTIDIGGGSTDLSLIGLDSQDFANISATELASDGDNEIAGNFISQLLAKYIDFPNKDRYPIVFPWEPKIYHANKQEKENGREIFNKIIFPLQKDDGFFRKVVGELGAEHKNQFWLNSEAVKDYDFQVFEEQLDEEIQRSEISLQLLTEHNTSETVSLTNDNIFNIAAFLYDFINQVSKKLHARILRLLENSPPGVNEIICIQSGRGALFPAISSMISGYTETIQQLNNQGDDYIFNIIRLRGEENSKGIVSSGACYINSFLNAHGGLEFHPKPSAQVGIITGTDPSSGNKIFSGLFAGVLLPEDGWKNLDYPCHKGNNIINLTFCRNPDNKDIIPIDEETHIVDLYNNVEFETEELAEQAKLLCKAETEDLIAVYIATPPVDNKDEDDFDNWVIQDIGQLRL